jgi:hypothetical protein
VFDGAEPCAAAGGAEGVGLRWLQLLYVSPVVVRTCVAMVTGDVLVGCSTKDGFVFPAQDVIDSIRGADLRARNLGPDRQSAGGAPMRAITQS